MAEVPTKRPIGRPRGEQVENTAQRRKQLIEAAITSIVEVGMSGTTLATVAKAAGLSQGVAVFYFKRKENLLVETLRYHYEEYTTVWKSALKDAGDDPVEKLMALVFADLDPDLCTPRNLALWNSFWGETAARPKFAEICDYYDEQRYRALADICQDISGQLSDGIWTAATMAQAFESMTDGMWTRMHITPDFMNLQDGRLILAQFMATVLPDEADRILARVEHLA